MRIYLSLMVLVYFYFYSQSLLTVQFLEILVLHTCYKKVRNHIFLKMWQINQTFIHQQYCLQCTLVPYIRLNSHSLWFHFVLNKETRQVCATSSKTHHCNAPPLILFKFDFDILANPHHGIKTSIANPNLFLFIPHTWRQHWYLVV